MIRIVLLVVLALLLPYIAWKLWRLFGPPSEISRLPGPTGPDSAPPLLALAGAGLVLVAITLTFFIMQSFGDPEVTYSPPAHTEQPAGSRR